MARTAKLFPVRQEMLTLTSSNACFCRAQSVLWWFDRKL